MLIKRQVPAGGFNANINKPYANMEEKLAEFFKKYDNKAPITYYDKTSLGINNGQIEKFITINPEDIIGYATQFTDTDMTVELNDKGIELFNSLKEPAIQIASLCNANIAKGHKFIILYRVIVLNINEINHVNPTKGEEIK